jgi:vacuolar-type H+-ATPase subunit E/Vma4
VRAGRASVDATFEGRLAQAREALRGAVADLLAGADDGAARGDPEEPS